MKKLNWKAVGEKALIETLDMREYWPLSLRQIYYRLVSAEVIPNTQNYYKSLSEHLVTMRLEGDFPWEAIEDRGRTFVEGFSSTTESLAVEQAIQQEADMAFDRYERNLFYGQPVHLEFWVEKDALLPMVERGLRGTHGSALATKGNISITFAHDYAIRAAAAGDAGQRSVVLYAGDFDPTGWNAPISMERRLGELGVDVDFRRVMLQKEDIDRYNLPADPSAMKKHDVNYQRFVAAGGTVAVELDAIDPGEFVRRVAEAAGEFVDGGLVRQEIQKREEGRLVMANVRERFEGFIGEILE